MIHIILTGLYVIAILSKISSFHHFHFICTFKRGKNWQLVCFYDQFASALGVGDIYPGCIRFKASEKTI